MIGQPEEFLFVRAGTLTTGVDRCSANRTLAQSLQRKLLMSRVFKKTNVKFKTNEVQALVIGRTVEIAASSPALWDFHGGMAEVVKQ